MNVIVLFAVFLINVSMLIADYFSQNREELFTLIKYNTASAAVGGVTLFANDLAFDHMDSVLSLLTKLGGLVVIVTVVWLNIVKTLKIKREGKPKKDK